MAAPALRTTPRLGLALDGATAARRRGALAPAAVPAAPCLRKATVRCQRAVSAAAIVEKKDASVAAAQERGGDGELTVVMKFGGSSVASAERMREVADLILSFPEERPVVVLSAMGKTTNKLLMVFYCTTMPSSSSTNLRYARC